jgi:hypothetical protein
MPLNYNLITNELEYQGLADLSVLVEDTSSNSPDYFRVSNLPKEFTAGKNTFHFKGNPPIFHEGSLVYIEILDSNGQALYYETALDLESEEQTAIVTVYVSESTPSGTAYIILCSTIRNDINGNFLDTSQINLRWTAPVYIDVSKRNDAEIIFNVLPEITITASTGSYTNLSYPGTSRFKSSTLGSLIYFYRNDTAVIVTASNATIGFDTGSRSGTVSINSNVLNDGYSGTITEHYSSSFTLVNAGAIVLNEPISLKVQNSISRFEPQTANITSADIIYEMSASGAQITQNSNNLATAFFSNLQPQVGEVAKIRSYYRSAGIGEYILSNETDISDQAAEFGFNANVVTASFFLPTIQRNDKLDFKFEFINPVGLASKQVIESLDNLFLGGNTYIGGDDNLLTGSLYVAGATGTGVHISGKGSSAMIRSIGYTGFQNAIGIGGAGGFVMYSGSVQSILGSAESYSGVGLELVANSASYFKYTTSGSGLLDVRTNSFFLGNTAGAFISGSNNNLQISSSNFFLGNAAGAFISGSNNNLRISASNFFIGNNNTFLSSSNNNLEILNYDGVKTKFRLDTVGNVTASAFIAWTGSSDTTSQVMMNTAVGLTDGKNIGRALYQQTTPITLVFPGGSSTPLDSSLIQQWNAAYSTTACRSAINSGSATEPLSRPWLNYESIVDDFSYYSLPFENTITIFGNIIVQKFSNVSTLPASLVLALRFTVWSPVTSSYAEFGKSGNENTANTDIGYVAGVSGSVAYVPVAGATLGIPSTATLPHTTIANDTSVWTPFKATISIPTGSQDRLNIVNLDYAFFKMNHPTTPPGTEFYFNAKIANLTVMSSRTLASQASSGIGDFELNDYDPGGGGA